MISFFTELRNKITASMRKKLSRPADHPRPQDDVPTERVLAYIVGDYQRMYNERQALIDYIRALESIYSEVQIHLYKNATEKWTPTKKRMLADERELLYDVTRSHLKAQEKLRTTLNVENK